MSRLKARRRRYSQYLYSHTDLLASSSHTMLFTEVAMLMLVVRLWAYSRSLCLPPPKAQRSPFPYFGERSLSPPWRAIIQRYFEQCGLHSNHQESLQKQ